jgi:hypothetical protein
MPQIVAQIVITLDDTGQVGVAAQVQPLQAYGMLEIARDVIKAQAAEAASRIQPARPQDLAALTPPRKN